MSKSIMMQDEDDLSQEQARRLMQIIIEDLEMCTFIGVKDWEKRERQRLTFNATISFDPGNSIHSDSIEDTLDYDSILEGVRTILENGRFNLLEKALEETLQFIMDHPLVTSCEAKLTKPSAHPLARGVSMSKKIERQYN